MITKEIIIHIFCYVNDNLPKIQKHSQAKLYLRGGERAALCLCVERAHEDNERCSRKISVRCFTTATLTIIMN